MGNRIFESIDANVIEFATMLLIPKYIIKRNVIWKSKILLPYLRSGQRVLDFGCGDMSLAYALKAKIPSLSITGIDVVGTTYSKNGLHRLIYNGYTLPFKKNSFDVVIAFHVFHHCFDSIEAYRECIRVTKKNVLFIEPIVRYSIERYSMSLMDWIYNSWKPEKISFTFQYKTRQQWDKCISDVGYKCYNFELLPSITSFLPFGIAAIYNVTKK